MAIEDVLRSEITRQDDPIVQALLESIIAELERRQKLINDAIPRLKKLVALENGGVDNWEWYGETMQEAFGDDEDDE